MYWGFSLFFFKKLLKLLIWHFSISLIVHRRKNKKKVLNLDLFGYVIETLMFYILSSSFYSKSKDLNVHQNFPVTHCIFISLLYIWYVIKHGVPCFTSANTRRNVLFIESPKSFFFLIYCPTDAKMIRYGMKRSFLFFLSSSSQMIINS